MFSRTYFTSQYREYTRLIKSRKSVHRLKFSTTVVLRTDAKEDRKSFKIETRDVSSTQSLYLRRIKQFLTGSSVGTLGAAGLAFDDNIDISDKSSGTARIISDVADQTASRILEPAITSTKGPAYQLKFSDPTILHPGQATAEDLVEATATSNASTNVSVDAIPEPPAIPSGTEYISADEVVVQLNALGQPTFSSMGLGGWTPVGMIQQCFEFLNVTMGIPWWGTIALGTVFIRLAMFPLVIMSQRNAAKMNNNLPALQAIQMKMTDARQCGNQLEVAKYSQEMMIFMKEKNVNPLKNMIMPLAQMPVFISFFISLREMANLPVESLKTGGMLWFTDLTLPDQYFLLPLITSATLWATVELGADTAKLSTSNAHLMKYALRALPIIVFPFTMNFPGAILVYWASSNFISLAQVGFLRIPSVRDYFKIEKQVKFDPSTLPIKPKGFKEGLKESWSNIKLSKELEERRRLDEIQFRRAGRGPIVKTYKYDPTKQISPNNTAAISAKKR